MKRKPAQEPPSLAVRWERALPWVVAALLALAPLLLGHLCALPGLAACCVLAALVAADLVLVGRRPAAAKRPAALALWVFLAWSWLTVITSVEVATSLSTSLQLSAAGLAAWLAVRVAGREGALRLALSGLVLGAILTSLWGLKEYIATLQSGAFTSWRTFSTFDNPNLLAGFLALSLPVSCALALDWHRRGKWVPVVALALGGLLQLVVLATTASRGGALALLAGLAAFDLALTWGRPAVRKLAFVALVCVALVAASLAVPSIRGRVSAALASRASSTIFRAYTWVGTARMIVARPVLGFGPGTFQIAFSQYKIAAFTRMTHQDYLQFAAQSGVPAGLAFLLFLLLSLRHAFPKREEEGRDRLLRAALFGALIAIAGHSLVDYDLQMTGGLLVCCVLAAFAWPRSEEAPQPTLRPLARYGWLPVLIALMLVSYAQLLSEQELQLGHLAILEDRDSEAAEHFAKAVAWGYHSPEAQLGLAEALVGQAVTQHSAHLLSQAEAKFLLAVEYSPSNPKYAFRQARYYLMRNDLPRALSALDRTLKLDPHYIKGYLVKAQVLRQLGRKEEAAVLWRQVLDLENSTFGTVRPLAFGKELGYGSAAYFLGRQALAAGKLAEARSLLQRGQAVVQANRDLPPHMLESLELAGSWTEADSRRLTALDGLLLLFSADLAEAEGRQGHAALARKEGQELLASIGLEPQEAEQLL